jgi:CDP-diacylglycerol---glycerol-3-phosphate 3-phosphatidyltransferase
LANLLTLIRVALIFVVVGVWARHTMTELWWIDILMVVLLGWVIFMDALDGWVARRRHEESDIGALFDIAGDRIVELVVWVFFAIRRSPDGHPYVPYWVAFIVITRTVVTDLIRSVAFQKGKTPFGKKTMQETPIGRQLVSSRWSRGSYGAMKAVAFCALGILFALDRMHAAGGAVAVARLATDVLVYATTLFCVVRAVPVVWDGRWYFVTRPRDAA